MTIQLALLSVQAPMTQYPDRHWDWGGHMTNMPFGGVFMLLALAAVVLLLFLLFRGFSRKDETPMDTLKRRYSSGEINKETYDQMRKDIEK